MSLEPTNLFTAFIVGAITSPHCVLMCGPLAYVVLSGKPTASPSSPSSIPLLGYHGTRVLMYAVIGCLAGLLSLRLITYWQMSPMYVFPWALVGLLMAFSLGLESWVPKFQFLKRITSRLTQSATKLPKTTAAILLGILTPLLPCGPLYLVFWTALLSGSPLYGATLCVGFGLGTIPIMVITQTQFAKFQNKLNPKVIYRIQRIIAGITAVLITWRLLMNDSPLQAEWCCPW